MCNYKKGKYNKHFDNTKKFIQYKKDMDTIYIRI